MRARCGSNLGELLPQRRHGVANGLVRVCMRGLYACVHARFVCVCACVRVCHTACVRVCRTACVRVCRGGPGAWVRGEAGACASVWAEVGGWVGA